MPSTRTTAESVVIVRDLLTATSTARRSVTELMDEYLGLRTTITDKDRLSYARAEVFNKIINAETEVDRLTVDLLSEIGALRRRALEATDTGDLPGSTAQVALLLLSEQWSHVAPGEQIVVGFCDEDALVCVDLTDPTHATIITAHWNPEAGFHFTTSTGDPESLDKLIGSVVAA